MTCNVIGRPDTGQFWGVRLYISQKAYGRTDVQEYYSFKDIPEKSEQKLILLQARMREESLREELDLPTLAEVHARPWNTAGERCYGRVKKSPVPIRGIHLDVESHHKTFPDWEQVGSRYYFRTYPPYINVMERTTDRTRVHERITFRTSTDWPNAYDKAIDAVLEIRPEYKPWEQEMRSVMPEWNLLKGFLQRRFKEHYGKYPWLVK